LRIKGGLNRDGVSDRDGAPRQRDCVEPTRAGVAVVQDPVEVTIAEPLGVLGAGNRMRRDQHRHRAHIDAGAWQQIRPFDIADRHVLTGGSGMDRMPLGLSRDRPLERAGRGDAGPIVCRHRPP